MLNVKHNDLHSDLSFHAQSLAQKLQARWSVTQPEVLCMFHTAQLILAPHGQSRQMTSARPSQYRPVNLTGCVTVYMR
jgi:hypothetical protein